MEKKISIIIPCYNVEKFIARCVESLVNQTIGIDSLELIFVNDASSDGTSDILLDYEKVYENSMMIIDLPENIKQGGARNVGLQYATADYIGFVDSDDWVEITMFEKLYEKAMSFQCDVVSCKFKRDYTEGSLMGPTGNEDRYYVIETEQARKEFLLNGFDGGIWSCIYKKDLIIENHVYFPEKITYEDNFWMPILQLYISDYYIYEEYLYHYYVNPQSTVLVRNSLHHFDRLMIELMKLEEYKVRGVFELYHDVIELQFLQLYYANTLHTIFTRFDDSPFEIFEHMQKTVLECFPNYKENPYITQNMNEITKKVIGLIDVKITKADLNLLSERYMEKQQ